MYVMKYYNNNPPTLYVSSIIGHSLPAVTVCPSMVTTNVKILEGAYNYFGNYKGNGCKYSGNHGVSPFNGYKYTVYPGEDRSMISGMAHIMERSLSITINSTVEIMERAL